MENVLDGFNTAYGRSDADVTALAGATFLPPSTAPMHPTAIPLIGPPTNLKNRAIEVDHAPVAPAYGYRFDYHGRSVVINGDTRYHPPLAVAAKGAEVMIHEAQSDRLIRLLQQSAKAIPGYSRIATILDDVQSHQTDPRDAARIANQAGVRLLIFNHPAGSIDRDRRLETGTLLIHHSDARHVCRAAARSGALPTQHVPATAPLTQ